MREITGTGMGVGIDAQGFANLSTAVHDPSTAGRNVVVANSFTVNNLTVPADRGLVVIPGGTITVNSGKTLTINGPFDGAPSCLAGSGTVTGLRRVEASWAGALGDGTDQTAALTRLAAIAATGTIVHFPAGDYRTSTPWRFTVPVKITGDDARFSLTSAGDYVIQIDGSGTGSEWMYGTALSGLILDGKGNATDGLFVKNTINGKFDDVRVTNVTGAGFHLQFCQLGHFLNPIVSNNVEAFTTTPINGFLIDGSPSSSANVIINPTIEHVSGSGIKSISAINTVILNGTSEGNDIGLEFGETDVGPRTSIGNTVIGLDAEVNTTSDLVLRKTASGNDFINFKAGYLSPPVQIIGSFANHFSGGMTSGFTCDGDSHDNIISGVNLLGADATVTDTGVRNSWDGVYNVSVGTLITDKPRQGYNNQPVAAGGTAAIDASYMSVASVTAYGATLTIANPTNAADGQVLDVIVHNQSGGAITTTWGDKYKITGWTEPANTKCRSIRFRYDTVYEFWYAMSIGPEVDNF